jgi:hypothetical protein
MNMNTPTINSDGEVQHADHHFDDWMISGVCASQMDMLTEDGGRHQVLKGAAVVAREARATGYNWEHASAVYARAATELGLAGETVEQLLALAHACAEQGFTHWSDLTRRFVYDWAEGRFVDQASTASLPVGEFNAIFAALTPDPLLPIGRFLIENDLVVQVDSMDEVKIDQRGCSPSCACWA